MISLQRCNARWLKQMTEEELLELPVGALNWGGKYNHNRIMTVFKYHTHYAPGHPDADPRGYVACPITKLRDVVAKSRTEWLRLTNLGLKSIDAMDVTLASVGLRMGAESGHETPFEEIVRLQAEVIKRLDRIDVLTAELRNRYQESLQALQRVADGD